MPFAKGKTFPCPQEYSGSMYFIWRNQIQMEIIKQSISMFLQIHMRGFSENNQLIYWSPMREKIPYKFQPCRMFLYSRDSGQNIYNPVIVKNTRCWMIYKVPRSHNLFVFFLGSSIFINMVSVCLNQSNLISITQQYDPLVFWVLMSGIFTQAHWTLRVNLLTK